MQNKAFEEDPRDAWQRQSPDEHKIALELIRLRAGQLAVKARLQFFAVIGLVFAVVVFSIWRLLVSPHSLQRAGFALAAGWAVYAAIKACQSIWPSTLARDAGSLTCLAFSRNELQRQLKYLGKTGGNITGPLVFTVLIFIAPIALDNPGALAKGMPVLVLFVVWLVSFVFIGRRDRQKLREELDILNRLHSRRAAALRANGIISR